MIEETNNFAICVLTEPFLDVSQYKKHILLLTQVPFADDEGNVLCSYLLKTSMHFVHVRRENPLNENGWKMGIYISEDCKTYMILLALFSSVL